MAVGHQIEKRRFGHNSAADCRPMLTKFYMMT